MSKRPVVTCPFVKRPVVRRPVVFLPIKRSKTCLDTHVYKLQTYNLFKNVRHPWANLKIFNPSKHFQKEFYAFAIILNALYGALKKSQWQKGVEYITILFSESHFIFRDISIFLWEAALLVSWTRRSRKGSIFALLKQKLFFTRVTIIRSTAAQSLVIVQFGMSKP